MGMGEREDYLATRIIDDKFMALDNTSHLTTWNTITGKVLSEINLIEKEDPLLDFSGFEIYSYDHFDHITFMREWFSKILLISKDPVEEDVNEAEYFHPDDIREKVKGQLPYAKYTSKKFHEFRLIELDIEDGEAVVKEVCSFIYPYWQGRMQFIYFSEDGEYMFERLVFQRFLIYRRVSIGDEDRPTRVRW